MDQLGLTKAPSSGTVLGALGAVLGLVALVISLSSSADASPNRALIHSGDIAPGAVTAKALAPGAVHAKAISKSAVTAKALANGAVNRRVLAKGAVTENSISADAVTATAIAPGSVYGGALGTETIRTTPIADIDQVASNPEWTAGNTEVALCAPGEALLGPGFAFTQPGNREVTWLQAKPFLSPTGSGVSGRVASNSGGSAVAEIMAICLK